MRREWSLNDVAVVRINGEELLAVKGRGLFSNNWYTAGPVLGSQTHRPASTVEVVRPLVVLDLDDSEQMQAVAKAYHESDHIAPWSELHSTTRLAIVGALRDGLRALISPRIPEPTTWGVVEAACVHSNQRRKWVRYGAVWCTADADHGSPRNPDDWDSLVDPVLIREGI